MKNKQKRWKKWKTKKTDERNENKNEWRNKQKRWKKWWWFQQVRSPPTIETSYVKIAEICWALIHHQTKTKKKQISPKIFQFKTFEKQMQACRCHCFWDWQKILSDKSRGINFGMKLFQRNADNEILNFKNKKKFSFRPTFWVNKIKISKIWSGLKLVSFVSRTDPMMNRQYQILCYITTPMSCVLTFKSRVQPIQLVKSTQNLTHN